jgi:hypothetical protein
MESYHAHQLILPTDKRNPCFTLYATEDQQSIRVFYGLELIEVVPDDPDQMAFKMLAGRLYNAGVLVAKLEEVFKADRKTIRAWGDAIVSRDPELLARVLLGRGVNQKRPPAIDHYVARRWPELLAEGCPNYRATLIREIESIFEVKFSGETLRQIILESKGSRNALSGAPPLLTATPASHPDEEIPCSENPITTTDDLAIIAPETSSQADCRDIDSIEDQPGSSKCFPPNWQPRPGETVLCDHVGILIFAGALSSIAQATSPPEPLLAQWLGSVMLGAVNIEQTKYLNWEDLGDLLGQTVRFPTSQREQLTRLATPATIDAVLRWNYQQLAIPEGECDLYYDPHTTHYTGTQNILKGWCAAIRWADKLINSDYIHTARGHPIYFECTDNFDDLRGRFFPLINRLRTSLQWSQERVLTLIVDRGIYSNDIFNQILADPNIHLVTWEKGYQSEKDTPWDTPYEQLRDELTDRQVPNRAYVEKVKTQRQLEARQARQLLAADRAQRDQAARQQRLEEIQSDIATRATCAALEPNTSTAATALERKELIRLHNAAKRHDKYRAERILKIESLHQQILQNEEQKSMLEKEVSRIDQLINQEMVRMDLGNKTLMDAIKITARNLFYRHFAPFKAAYDNYRDDHDHYRQLTQCDGVLRWTGTEIEVHLVPQVNYPPKLRKIIVAHLDELNAGGLTLPDGRGRPLRLRLTRKEQISVRINDNSSN